MRLWLAKYLARAVKGDDLRSPACSAWVRIPQVLFLFHLSFIENTRGQNSNQTQTPKYRWTKYKYHPILLSHLFFNLSFYFLLSLSSSSSASRSSISFSYFSISSISFWSRLESTFSFFPYFNSSREDTYFLANIELISSNSLTRPR